MRNVIIKTVCGCTRIVQVELNAAEVIASFSRNNEPKRRVFRHMGAFFTDINGQLFMVFDEVYE